MILSQYFILDYLPMRNLNFCCSRGSAEYAHAWLSSNEEFEYISYLNPSAPFFHLIIFQWGIWISQNDSFAVLRRSLDYLPMRNLNSTDMSVALMNMVAWLSSNEEFESGRCYVIFLCWQLLDYLPMRNLNPTVRPGPSETHVQLDYLPMRNLNFFWFCYNLIQARLDYLPMRNLNFEARVLP